MTTDWVKVFSDMIAATDWAKVFSDMIAAIDATRAIEARRCEERRREERKIEMARRKRGARDTANVYPLDGSTFVWHQKEPCPWYIHGGAFD